MIGIASVFIPDVRRGFVIALQGIAFSLRWAVGCNRRRFESLGMKTESKGRGEGGLHEKGCSRGPAREGGWGSDNTVMGVGMGRVCWG